MNKPLFAEAVQMYDVSNQFCKCFGSIFEKKFAGHAHTAF